MITIENKDYELAFDFDFMRKANKKFGLNENGINIKNGIPLSMMAIMADDIETIMDYIILAAKPALSYTKLREYVGKLMMKDDDGESLKEFIDAVKEEIKEGMTTRIPFKDAVKMLEEGQKKAQKA